MLFDEAFRVAEVRGDLVVDERQRRVVDARVVLLRGAVVMAVPPPSFLRSGGLPHAPRRLRASSTDLTARAELLRQNAGCLERVKK